MKIKEVAEMLNLSPRAIRFYEEQGLLSPPKNDANRYRTFTANEIWRLQTIAALREAGMPIEEIRKCLDERAAGTAASGSEELRYYLELQRSALAARWVEIKQMIDTADRMLDILNERSDVPSDELFRLASCSRKQREQRKSWLDRWNYDRLAPIHDENVRSDSGDYADYESALAAVTEWVSPLPGERGLDLGTGTGNLAAKLIERGARMAGVDQSAEMLRRCRSKLPDMETKLGNLLALPFDSGEFDFVAASFAVRHLTKEQVPLALEEIRRVLKPHGRICFADLMNEDAAPDSGGSPALADWLRPLEESGYIFRTKKINEALHLVLAVPIRK